MAAQPVHLLEQANLFFAYFLLVRVVDQVGVGFRRALYFAWWCALPTGYAVWMALRTSAGAVGRPLDIVASCCCSACTWR